MTSSINAVVRRWSGGGRRAAVSPLVALVFVLGVAAAVAALVGAAARPAAAATSIQGIVDRWRVRTPVHAVTVVLSDPGGDVRSVVSGRDAGRPVGVDARFRVGSVTKAFVATVVLQLIDENRLELDAPLGRYVPASPFGDVTIRQLLSHTGGVPDFEQASGYTTDLLARPSRRWTTTDVLGLVADRDRDFPPGSAYAYSNTDAVLLGQVVDAVTDRSWAHAVQRRVIDRLDLRDTTVPGGAAAAPGVVAGWFDTSGDGFDDRVPDPWPALETSQGPAGALVSTAPDLAVFARALFEGDMVSRAARRAMTTLQPFHPRHSNYGLGIELRRPDHRTIVWGHGGSLPGYRATMWYLPLTRRVVVVLANAYRASTDDLAELLLHR